uniref:Portal protein n=1 Tax=viral metagenome TaxID=1070528 RepID=A0A6M3KB60_9ZZZZ
MPKKEDIISKDLGRLRTFWQPRTDRIKEMYQLRRLTDENKKKDHESVVSNDPATFLRLATHLISFMQPIFRIPLTDDEQQRTQSGKSERALVSLWRERDAVERKRGRQAWRRQLADLILTTGWYAVLATVVKEKGGSPKFLAEIWNPNNVFQEWDDDGLATCIHAYSTTWEAADKKARGHDKEIPPRQRMTSWGSVGFATIIDWWKKEEGVVKHGLKIGNSLIIDPETVSPFEEIPIITGPVLGEAGWGGYDLSDTDWKKYYGQSLFEPNFELYKKQNNWMSWHQNLIKEFAYPLTKDTSTGGREVVTAEDIRAGKLIHLAPGQDVTRERPPGVPQGSEMVLGTYTGQIQRGSFPWVMYGSTPFRMSGTALNQLLQTAHTVVGPFHEALRAIISDVSFIWLSEYKRQKMKGVSISGKRLVGENIGSFFQEEFSPADVPDALFVDAEIKLATPSDLMERISIARVAKPQGDLLDLTTILDELLEQQDPVRIQERIAEGRMNESEILQRIILLRKMKAKVAALRIAGDNEGATLLDQFVTNMLNEMQPRQQGATPPERLATPGAMGQTSESRRLAQYIEGQGASPQYVASQQELNQYRGVE